MRRLLQLLLGSVLVWAVLAVPAHYLLPDSSMELTGLVGLGCLIPAAISLLIVQAFRGKSPEEQLLGSLLAIMSRLGLTLAIGVGLYFLVPLVRDNTGTALVWGVIFYLIFMAMETAMVYSLVRGAPSPNRRDGS